MFELPIMLFIITIMSIVHIGLWHIFPEKVRHLLFSNPFMAFIIDLGGSVLIETFTGVASIVGICNLAASVIFGFYAYFYGRHLGIKGMGIDWFKLWNKIPICPKVIVIYEKNGKITRK